MKLERMAGEEWTSLRRSTVFSYRNHHDSNEILRMRLRDMFEGFIDNLNDCEFGSVEQIHEIVETEYRSWKKYRMLEGVSLDIDGGRLLTDHELLYEGMILDCLKFVIVFKINWEFSEITGYEID